MKTIITLLFTFIFLRVPAQVPNHSFEHWTAGNPDDWQTTNLPIVPQNILQDSDAYVGSYSVRGVVVSNNFNQPYPPYLGMMGASATGFYIGVPYAELDGYCKLNFQTGDKFIGIVHVYNSIGEPIGDGSIALDSSVAGWTPFSIGINYTAFDVNMTCAAYFTITDSTGNASGQVGSEFKLDDLSMSGVAVLNVPTEENELVSIYPNPSEGNFHLRLKDFQNTKYFIEDTQGRLITSFQTIRSNEIEIENLNPGIYFLNLISGNKKEQKKIVVAQKW